MGGLRLWLSGGRVVAARRNVLILQCMLRKSQVILDKSPEARWNTVDEKLFGKGPRTNESRRMNNLLDCDHNT